MNIEKAENANISKFNKHSVLKCQSYISNFSAKVICTPCDFRRTNTNINTHENR